MEAVRETWGKEEGEGNLGGGEREGLGRKGWLYKERVKEE